MEIARVGLMRIVALVIRLENEVLLGLRLVVALEIHRREVLGELSSGL